MTKEDKKENNTVRRTAEDADTRAEQIRAKRRAENIDPLAPKYKLHNRNTKKGWRYFWAVNKENRIYELEQLGYQVDESVDPISAGDSMGGQKLIRMMIPESIYKEDFARKQGLIADNEKALRSADVKGGLKQEDGAYGDIHIGQKTVKLGSTQN